MHKLRFLYSFRVRLLLVLAGLLIATLCIQFYLNRRAQQRTSRLIAEQEQALTESTALAIESISSTKYLHELDEEKGLHLLKRYAGRVVNVLIVGENGRIDDSLDPRYMPRLNGGGARYFQLAAVPLPKLVEAAQAAEEIKRLLPAATSTTQPVAGEPRAVPIRTRTNAGTNYLIVVLGSGVPGPHSHWEDVEPLLPTLAVLLGATLVTVFLVWRFTRPLGELMEASRRVAAGDFAVRVPSADRRDEMGALAATFNQMVADLSRAREIERQLQQVERSATIGRLAAAIAHEIKNPLNYINLSLDHLCTNLAPEDGKKREMFERLTGQVKSEVARINTRIKEFLNYTRPAKLELRPLNLRAEIDAALGLVEAQAAENGIEVRVAKEENIPPVIGDSESLRSVFTNLMINALQAMDGGRGGRLTITLSSENEHIRVHISDTGRGIPPEHLAKIFEPYYSTKETGTGLGLAIVKKAVEDHGGTITVESKTGEGTTFTVELPAKVE